MNKNHYGTTTGKTYRLSVCLKRFFSDERARCFITADSGLRFRWLGARMRRLFGLKGPFCLVSRGHLLPPDEPVGLLSPDDLVEVIPKHYKMFPDTSESDVSEASEIIDLFELNYEKPKDTAPVAIPPEQAVKGDHDKTSDETDACQSKNTAIPEQNYSFTGSQSLQEIKIDELENVQNRNLNNTDNGKLEEVENEKLEAVKRKALELLDQCSIPPKRKRKRVRRRKQCTAVQESEDNAADTNNVYDEPHSPPSSETVPVIAAKNEERSIPSQHADTPILRNNMEHRRPARLVHSLS